MYELKGSYKSSVLHSEKEDDSKTISTSIRISPAFRKKLKSFIDDKKEFQGVSTAIRELAKRKLQEVQR